MTGVMPIRKEIGPTGGAFLPSFVCQSILRHSKHDPDSCRCPSPHGSAVPPVASQATWRHHRFQQVTQRILLAPRGPLLKVMTSGHSAPSTCGTWESASGVLIAWAAFRRATFLLITHHPPEGAHSFRCNPQGLSQVSVFHELRTGCCSGENRGPMNDDSCDDSGRGVVPLGGLRGLPQFNPISPFVFRPFPAFRNVGNW